MPINVNDGYQNTSINSLKELNENIEKFILIDYFTQVEIDEDDDSGMVKIPELESYSIIDHSKRHMDLKLIFNNPLHVSSKLERDFVNIRIQNA